MLNEHRGYREQGLLTRGRVVSTALQQAARHERAVSACLAEIDGIHQPDAVLIAATRRRVRHHLERALGLTRTAMRLNPDGEAASVMAALLEREERFALRAERILESAALSSSADLG